MADFLLVCSCPGFSPLITRCIRSSVFPERNSGWFARVRDGLLASICIQTALLRFIVTGEKNKCTTPFIWGVEPGLEGREGCCLFFFPLEYRELKAAKERDKFAQQRYIFNSNELSYSTFPQANWTEPCLLQWPAFAARWQDSRGKPALHVICAIYSGFAERP